MREDAGPRFREHVVFALSQSHEPKAVDTITDVAKRDGSAHATKVVGRRRLAAGLVPTAPLLALNLRLRGEKPFLPRGVYRFRSFEESADRTRVIGECVRQSLESDGLGSGNGGRAGADSGFEVK